MVNGVKRWKKGQSSSSNPTTKRYRDVVKQNKFFNFGLPNSNGKQQKNCTPFKKI